MKLFTQKTGNNGIGSLLQNVSTLLSEKGNTISNESAILGLTTYEGDAPSRDGNAARESAERAYDELQGIFKEAKIYSAEQFTETAKEARAIDASFQAGAIAAVASHNPKKYAKAAMNMKDVVSREGYMVIEPDFATTYGDFGYTKELTASTEAFETTELQRHQAFSVVYNIQASRQGPLAEAFFPPVVQTPDLAGVEVSVNNVFVMNEVRHALKGHVVEFKRKNLIRAVADWTILSAETTRLYPVVVASGSDQNTDKFVASSAVAPATVEVAGVSILTAPLKIDEPLDILGLSQNPALTAAGFADETDAIDGAVHLENLYLNVLGASENKVIKLNTRPFVRSQFLKSGEGNEREMKLDFVNNHFTLSGETRDIAGGALAALGDVTTGNYRLVLQLDVNGTLDVQTGAVRVTKTPVVIKEILDANGGVVTDATIVNAIKTQFGTGANAPVVIGYDLEARRSNSNRRTRGIILDTNRWTEIYKVYTGAPITVQRVIDAENAATDVASLIAATRIRNDNNAVTALLSYADTLKFNKPGFNNADTLSPALGIGRLLIKPYYEEISLDVQAKINSIKTHERDADIREIFGNTIRTAVYDMFYKTQYGPALEMVTGGTAGKPHVVIGTDPVIEKYLFTQGDSRLLGDAFSYEVVSTVDKRFENLIIIAFKRKEASANGADPLSLGFMAWMPELLGKANISRNGRTTAETVVQPRTRHQCLCPAMVKIVVSGLLAAAREKTDAPQVIA